MDVCRDDRPKAYAATAKQCAEAVIQGNIVASNWVRLVCQRQIDDLKRLSGKASPYQSKRRGLDQQRATTNLV